MAQTASMDRRTVLTKTAKGLMEVTGKTSLLPRDLRNVLSQVDGKATVGDLHMKLDRLSEAKLFESLGKLVKEGFVREFVSAPASVSPPSQVPIVQEDVDLDFSALISRPPSKAEVSAQNNAEAEAVAREVARAQAESRARAEAAAKAKADTEARAAAEAKARAEADARTRAEATERARREAEAKARAEAEAKARAEAEAKARAEAEAKARAAAEAKARAETEAKARAEAEAKARGEAEAKARAAAEAKARAETEAKARAETEAKARAEAEAKARADAAARARAEAEAKARAEAAAKAQAEAQAKRDAEERARRELEAKARVEAEARARAEAEARTKREAEERARREAEERARREAEQKAQAEAEARARAEAEARARREAEEQARRDEEERKQKAGEARIRRELEERMREAEEGKRAEDEARAKAEADARAKVEAEARARQEAEEAARRAAEALQRAEAEVRAKREGEETAKREAEEAARRKAEEERARKEAEKRSRDEERARAKAEAEAAAQARKEERSREKAEAEARAREKAKQEQREAADIAVRVQKIRSGKKFNVGKTVGIGLGVLLVGGLAYLQFMPIDKSEFEGLAQQKLGQPVRIGSAAFSMFPSPAVRFENVAIGAGDMVRIGRIAAVPEVASLFSGPQRVFRSVHLSGVTLTPAALGAVLFGTASADGNLVIGSYTADNVTVVLPGMTLPPVAATASVGGNGAIARVQATTADKSWSMDAVPGAGRASLEISARNLEGVLGVPFKLTDFSAKGVATPAGITFSEFDARALDGLLRGKGQLKWGDGWVLDGELTARQVEAAQLAPKLIQGGRLEGQGVFSLGAPSPDKLFASPRLDGSFLVTKGTLAGVDLARMMGAGASASGITVFNELAGKFVLDQSRLGVRELRMNAGLLGATGSVDVDAAGALSGTMRAEMRTPGGGVQRANITVSGSAAQGVQARR